MANEEILKVLKQGATAWNQWKENNPDSETDFSGVDLRGANLQSTNLEKASFRKTKLQFANLNKANLEGASLKGARLQQANLQAPTCAGQISSGLACWTPTFNTQIWKMPTCEKLSSMKKYYSLG